jgi:PAS domain S-box-containing protein
MNAPPQTEIDQLRRRVAELEELLRTSPVSNGASEPIHAQFAVLELLYRTVPVGLAFLDTSLRYQRINELLAAINGLPVEAHIGQTIEQVLPEIAEVVVPHCLEVMRSGRSKIGCEIRAATKAHGGAARFYRVSYHPVQHAGKVIGVGVVVEDTTAQKAAENAVSRSERELRFVFENAPAFIAYISPDCRYVRVNRSYEEWFGRPAQEIHGKHIREMFGEEYFESAWPRIQSVLAGENVRFEATIRGSSGDQHEMAVRYTPDLAADGTVKGFIALVQDITDRKRAQDALRAQETQLSRLLAALPDVISRFDRNLRILYTSPAVERFTGHPPDFFVGKTHLESGLPSELCMLLDDALRRIFETGQMEVVEFDFVTPELGARRLTGTGVPETGADGRVASVLTIVRDITEPEAAARERAELLERERQVRETAELLNRVGPTLAAELDTQKLVQAVTDIATRLTDAEFGSFFHNVVDESGESYMLYTLSGVPREAFAKFPMPRNTAVFAPTFRGEGVVRSDDITQDPRYGNNPPHRGMPQGHLPVRSYLAGPVVSRSGDVLGGLFFGHSQAGRFTEKHEAILNGIAAQAAIALDNARLFEQGRWAQDELKRSNEELRRANKDLETFAYSASHDLQEPLRNIAICAQLLERSGEKVFAGDSAKFLDGILQGAARMESLVKDLLAYTRATQHTEGPLPTVDSRVVLEQALFSLKNRIEETGAKVTHDELPSIAMHEVHLSQLFQNLVGNALKYRGKEAPHVHVSAARQQGWRVFSVTDNGIGIHPKYGTQIFGLFKRLHSRDEYPGSGIGLAICQRIVQQYGGRIWLESSVPGKGSVFSFAIPDR